MRALVVVAGATSVASALASRGWNARIIDAGHGRTLIRVLTDEPPDVVVPVGLGAPCADGGIFALSRLAGVPCAGPTPQAGAIMHDRSLFARVIDSLFALDGWVRGPRGRTLDIHSDEEEIAAAVSALPPPLVVKPAYWDPAGSTDSPNVHNTHEEAAKAVHDLLPGAGKVLVQRWEPDVRMEISCVVLDTPRGPDVLPLVEHRADRRVIPARLSAETVGRVESTVLALQRAAGAVGLTQTDLLITGSGDIVVLAAHAIPSLAQTSVAGEAAASAGMSYADLCVAYAGSALLPRPEPDTEQYAWASTATCRRRPGF